MGSAPSAPANTTSTTTVNQSPWQNPTYQALMLGDSSNPGPVTSMLRASNALMQQYNTTNQQGLTPAAQAALGTWNPATASSTANLYNKLDPATGRYTPTANPNTNVNAVAANQSAAAGQPIQKQAIQTQAAAEGGEMRKFATGSSTVPASSGSTGQAPYGLLDTLGRTAYFDPTTGQSTLPDFLQLQSQVRNLKTPEQFQQASKQLGITVDQLQRMANYAPQQVAAQQTVANQMQGPQQWNTMQAAQYMDPYVQAVIRSQQQLANQNYMQQLNQLKGQGVKAGAYGGSRQALSEQNAQFNQNMLLNNLAAQGLSNAYQQGLQQFNTAQGQGLQAGQANLSAAQQSALANQQAALQAAIQNQQAGLSANQQNIGATSAAGQAAQGLGALGTAQNQATLANIGALGQSAQAQQNLGQQYLNTQQQNAATWMGMPATINTPVANVINAQPASGGTNASQQTYNQASWADGGEVEKDSWASDKKKGKDSWAYASKKSKK